MGSSTDFWTQMSIFGETINDKYKLEKMIKEMINLVEALVKEGVDIRKINLKTKFPRCFRRSGLLL